jgi:hypothetical protein
MSYIESSADHAFTAFLSSLTPSKVLRDRSAMFTRVERKRERFLIAKGQVEKFTDRQLQIAHEWAERNAS